MSGGEKAAAIIALAVIATLWFNWRMWRTMRAAKAERAGWSDADFDSQLVANGIDPRVPPVVRASVVELYGAGVSPHPDDDFIRFLAVDDEEVAELVAQGFVALGLPLPSRSNPAVLPRLKDLRDLAEYLDGALRATVRSNG